MTYQSPLRVDSLPVALVNELPPVEAAAVLALRMWDDGAAARAHLHGRLSRALGDHAAGAAVEAMAELGRLMARHGRRPLRRHQPGCDCVDADEACFASLITAASEGRHEDALMIAVLMVRPDVAPLLVGLAGNVGHALRRADGRADRKFH